MGLNLNRVDMPNREPEIRNKDFIEVAEGYNDQMAQEEAERCLNCKKPLCRQGCPVNIDIPRFIHQVTENDFDGAYYTLKEYSLLPAVCGRVCPQESQCEGSCILNPKGAPVGIGRLERYVADKFRESKKVEELQKKPDSGKKVAVIGGGPAGLACAYDLAKEGHKVKIFEALHTLGGVLMYGIPEFRLPKSIVDKEIENIEKLGVEIELNSVAGRVNTVDKLMNEEGFDAVFIATGAGLPYFLNIPGENLNEVYSANEFLTRVNLMKAYKYPEYDTPVIVGEKVAVVGAGNVAMDAARTAKRLGAKDVYIVYRRSKDEVPARHEELEHAEEEGINLQLLTSPIEVLGDEQGHVTGLRCLKYELGAPDEGGRRRPVEIPGSEFDIPIDMVVMAIGQGPNPLLLEKTKGLELNKRGNIVADDNGVTSLDGVFAGGDIVTGAATVILAMGAGKKTAAAINKYLENK
ncbi:MAG: NADPH-dependent glutamate synthase [Fusobacteria bacterium]|nr:NADPH-dependent glutamate synthase [Fusobacteriota bacterium]